MNKKILFAFLVAIGAIAQYFVQLDFYPQLSQGDHGRDLYAVQAVLRGEQVYKDFWWVYGPLMPYYYAFFYKFLGGSIASILLGKALLHAGTAVLFYYAASVWLTPVIALIAALWFTQSQQDFFFTFNHQGGITAEIAILFLLFAYIKSPRMNYLWGTLPLVIAYALVKLNFGLASLAVVIITIFVTDWVNRETISIAKKKFYIAALTITPGVIFLIYWLLLKDLTFAEVRQCMPFFGDDQPHHFSPAQTIPYYFTQHWLTLVHQAKALQFNLSNPLMTLISWLPLPMTLAMHSSTLATFWLFFKNKIELPRAKHLLLSLFVLGLFFVLNFHEFVVSGVWYRTYWSAPFLTMFHFLMMGTALALLPRLAKGLIWSVFALLMAIDLAAAFFSTQQQKIPPRYIGGPHGKAFVGNEIPWTQTVNNVSAFLATNLKPDETFLALPYDCIYYYLTGKKSPTRELIFFDHIHITPAQEVSIITELQSHKVKYVLISNRMASPETGLGIFGKTYCPLLSAYIAQHYIPIARQGGEWDQPPGWGHNHGVMILQKKP